MRDTFRGASGLKGKKVAILAADGFEYLELIAPEKALRLAGAEVDIVSLHRGKIRGMNLTEPTRTVRVDRTLEEASPDAYDALFVPGGFIGPDLLRQSVQARDFVRAFDVANKPIATLCHGPWLLVSAELVSGRRLASWPGIRDDIVHAGGIWRDEAVVHDRNWVSSRTPADLPAFIPAMRELFASGALASTAAPVSQAASSAKPERPIPLAVAAARLLPGPTLRTIAGTAAIAAAGAFGFRRAARHG